MQEGGFNEVNRKHRDQKAPLNSKYGHQAYIMILTVLIILGIMTSFAVGQIFVTAKLKEVQFTMSLIAKNIEMRIDSAQTITELAAKMPSVSSHNSVEAEMYLNEIVSANPKMWSHFLITDKDGIEIAHTEGSQHYGKSLAERDYYVVPWTEGHPTVAQPIHSVSTGRKIIAIGVPTYQNGERNGVLVGFIHLAFVSDLLNENNFSPNSYLFMVNYDGTISAHVNEDYVLAKHMSEITQDTELLLGLDALGSGVKLGNVEDTYGLVTYAPAGKYKLSIVSFIPFQEGLITPIVTSGVLLLIFAVIISLVVMLKKVEKTVIFGREMENTANTDKLTGLKNRHWLETMSADFECADFLTAIFLDIDDFKLFNDNHDHTYGDEVLKFVGQSLLHSTRPSSDACIRYAGDEFVVLLKDTAIDNVVLVAERLRTTLKGYHTENQADPIYISCGIACAKKGELTMQELIVKADIATYQAKHAGKNSIYIAE